MIINGNKSHLTLAEGQWIDTRGYRRLDFVHAAVRRERLRYLISRQEATGEAAEGLEVWEAALKHPRGKIEDELSAALFISEMLLYADEEERDGLPEHVHTIEVDPLGLTLLRKVAQVDYASERRVFEGQIHFSERLGIEVNNQESENPGLPGLEDIGPEAWREISEGVDSTAYKRSFATLSVASGIYHAITNHFNGGQSPPSSYRSL